MRDRRLSGGELSSGERRAHESGWGRPMRVLSVLPYAAGAAYSGGSARRIELTRAVGRFGEHRLVVLADLDDAARRNLAEVFKAEVVCAPTRRRRRGQALAYWLTHPTVPWTWARTDHSPVRDVVSAEATPTTACLIWCNGVETWPSVPRELRHLAAVDAHDLPSRNRSELLRTTLRRWVRGRREARKGRALEPRPSLKGIAVSADVALRTRLLEGQIGRWSRALIVSSHDEAAMRRRTVVVPNGASEPTDQLSPGQGTRFVFPAQFGYPPNVDGAEWFALEVLPLLRRRMRDPAVVLAGSGSDKLMRLATDHGLDFTGYVEHFDDVYDDDTVVVVPLLSGSGTRIKILEAWARGLPVVSTSKGAEGLRAVPGEDALIADTPADFARACAEVARSSELRARLSQGGRRRFAEGGSWAQAQEVLLRWLDGTS